MFRHTNDLQLSVKEKPKNISYTVTKWWKSLNRNIALKLINLARSGDRMERMKAVYYLSNFKYLKGNYKLKFLMYTNLRCRRLK